MADGFVGVAVDGAGKKVDTTEITVGANTVERQRVQLAGNAAGDLVKTRSDGFLSVMMDPTTILVDTHDSTPDTTNVWTQGGTVTPAYATGSVAFSPSTTASASSYMYSKAVSAQSASGWLIFASVFTLDAAVVTGNKRFMGCGIMAGTPTMAAPLANGAVFEISDVDGLLYAVTYSNSIRVAQIALTRPTDGGPHRYAVYHKTSKLLYELDGVIVATINNPNLQGSIFSALCGSFNGATTLATAATLVSSIMSLGDSGRNNTRISDATYPWRQTKVSATGDLSVSIATMPTTPVTGAFFQTTQPVSGTFFQTTQPVSIATMPSTPVTGTFFQATQPVSLATNTPTIAAGTAIIGKVGIDQTTPGTTNLVSIGTTGTVAINAALPAGANTIGAVNIAATQTLATVTTVGAVTAITNALPTGANTIGAVNIAAAQTLATVTTVGAVTAITNALPAGTNKIGTVDVATAPATAKGTQGANALPTQDLKDAGRNLTTYYTLVPVLATATDTLQSLTGTKGGVTVTATTTPAVVTTAKAFRITRMSASYISTATSGFGIVRLRAQSAGIVTITSPVIATVAVGNATPATANAGDTVEAIFEEGLEVAAGFGVGISAQGFAAATATAVGYVMVSVTGYEY